MSQPRTNPESLKILSGNVIGLLNEQLNQQVIIHLGKQFAVSGKVQTVADDFVHIERDDSRHVAVPLASIAYLEFGPPARWSVNGKRV